MKEACSWIAKRLTLIASSSVTTVLALVLVVLWGIGGLIVGFSTEYQLPANTVTTLVTYVLGFAILYTQARDTAALQLKLNELIAVDREARNSLINAENFSDAELARMIEDLQKHAAERVPVSPQDTPEGTQP